ncbi:MAG: hypothetical protein RL748_1107, partial [Pseudomonadota bacterium]
MINLGKLRTRQMPGGKGIWPGLRVEQIVATIQNDPVVGLSLTGLLCQMCGRNNGL